MAIIAPENAPKIIAATVREIARLQETYKEAQRESDDASRRAVTILNALNSAQKRLDEAFAALRKGAPRGSDWRENRPKTEAAAIFHIRT